MTGQYWKCTNKEQLQACFEFLCGDIPKEGWKVEWSKWKDQRSLPQNDLSWMWYEELAKQITKKIAEDGGCAVINRQDMHDRLVVERYGQKLVKIGGVEVYRMEQTHKFDTAKMHDYLCWVEQWAISRGLKLTIPGHSEYMKMKEAQIK